MGDRVLVLGANGYLGRHLARVLADAGAEILQSGRSGMPVQEVGRYVAADIRDREAVARLVRGVNEIYFAAGTTGTTSGYDRYGDFLEVNLLGLMNVLDALRREGSRARIVFPSTRLVYRGRPGKLAEDSDLELKTPYALSKFAGEQLLQMYGSTFDLQWVAFRVCVAYGEEVPGPRPAHGTVISYVERAQRGEDLVVFGTGTQRRTLTHVADIAAMMVVGARDERSNRQVLNVGGPDELSVREIAEEIARAHGVSVRDAPWPDLAARVESGDTVFDATRLESWIGRHYRYRFREWVRSERAQRHG